MFESLLVVLLLNLCYCSGQYVYLNNEKFSKSSLEKLNEIIDKKHFYVPKFTLKNTKRRGYNGSSTVTEINQFQDNNWNFEPPVVQPMVPPEVPPQIPDELPSLEYPKPLSEVLEQIYQQRPPLEPNDSNEFNFYMESPFDGSHFHDWEFPKPIHNQNVLSESVNEEFITKPTAIPEITQNNKFDFDSITPIGVHPTTSNVNTNLNPFSTNSDSENVKTPFSYSTDYTQLFKKDPLPISKINSKVDYVAPSLLQPQTWTKAENSTQDNQKLDYDTYDPLPSQAYIVNPQTGETHVLNKLSDVLVSFANGGITQNGPHRYSPQEYTNALEFLKNMYKLDCKALSFNQPVISTQSASETSSELKKKKKKKKKKGKMYTVAETVYGDPPLVEKLDDLMAQIYEDTKNSMMTTEVEEVYKLKNKEKSSNPVILTTISYESDRGLKPSPTAAMIDLNSTEKVSEKPARKIPRKSKLLINGLKANISATLDRPKTNISPTQATPFSKLVSPITEKKSVTKNPQPIQKSIGRNFTKTGRKRRKLNSTQITPNSKNKKQKTRLLKNLSQRNVSATAEKLLPVKSKFPNRRVRREIFTPFLKIVPRKPKLLKEDIEAITSTTQAIPTPNLIRHVTPIPTTTETNNEENIVTAEIQLTSEHGDIIPLRTNSTTLESRQPASTPVTTKRPPPTKPTKYYHDDYNYLDYEYIPYLEDPDAFYLDDSSEESVEVPTRKITQKTTRKSTPKTTPKPLKKATTPAQKKIKTPSTKRIKKKKKSSSSSYDDDYDDASTIVDYFGSFMTSMVDMFTMLPEYASIGSQTIGALSSMYTTTPRSELNPPRYPHYTYYDSGSAEQASTGNKFGSWMKSWFKFGGAQQKTNTIEDSSNKKTGWLEGWFDSDDGGTTPLSDPDYDENWPFNWFQTSESTTKRPTTTATIPPPPTETAPAPQEANPEKWIGILAEHLANVSTTTTTPAPKTSKSDELKKISYDKFQIWRLKPSSDNQFKILETYRISADGAKLQWLKGPSLKGYTDVLVSPKHATNLQGTLNYELIDHEVLIFDVGKAISYEKPKLTEPEKTKLQAKNGHPMTWYRYHLYDDIVKFLEYLQLRYPSFVELIHLGRSYEGRPLIIVKIEDKKFQSQEKRTSKRKPNGYPTIFIEAGSHGREWVGPATVTWILKELVKIMRSNATQQATEFIKRTVWYIMPVLNPDGYDYSHLYDRFWRKTRSKHRPKSAGILNSAMSWLKNKQSEKICYGVDANRNWDHEWGQKGSSKSQCNEFFAGPNVFSEPETRAASKFLIDHWKNIQIFISMHSYGQMISIPNGLNSSTYSLYSSQRMNDLLDMAEVGADALKTYGSTTRYKVDPANEMCGFQSGAADYFALYELGIPYSFSIDLADTGAHGFLLPASDIESTARDAFEIVKSMIDLL